VELASRESILSKFNGCIYLLLTLAFVAELFIKSENLVIINIVYAFFSIVMTVVMAVSIKRVVRYLRYLGQSGVRPATKTITV